MNIKFKPYYYSHGFTLFHILIRQKNTTNVVLAAVKTFRNL